MTSPSQFVVADTRDTALLHEAEAAALDKLTEELGSYLSAGEVAEVRRAYRFGASAHLGQSRKSGEPYITHPLAVATVLAEMRLEAHTIIAGILHDTIEDTAITFDSIVEAFDEDVAVLVEAVTKLDKIHFSSREEQQAENFRKMLLAMSRDIRVILIKLADRLHNMRTMGAMEPASRRRIGRETLDIYAPLASRLGMNAVRKELENRGFASVYPWRHAALSNRLKKRWGHRKDALSTVQKRLEMGVHEAKLSATITGREKHLYSLYKKMRNKRLDFSEVMDVFALRIIVNSVDDCYRMIGIAHNAFSPVPGRFKDYIAIPKANGYQSLHTVLQGPDGVPIELQIRTEMQDRVAENGIAAHWLYKADSERNVPEARSLQWLRSLLEIQQQSGNSTDFLDNVKVDLFPDEVYVFTPKGKIMRLPQNSTVIDFAFAVHSDIGCRTIGARVDRRLTPLSTPLINGQTVEIITSKNGRPNPAWLDFATTAKARSVIRHFLQGLQEREAGELGRDLLDSALNKIGSRLDDIPEAALQRQLDSYRINTLQGLLIDIGMGNRSPMLVAHGLIQPGDDDPCQQAPTPLVISGGEGMAINLAKCCHPIPGDTILGYLSSGRGMVVHRRGCNNLADYRKHPEKWLELSWADTPNREHPAQVRISTINRRGVLASVASLIAAEGCNIEHVESSERDGNATSLVITFTVRNRVHLATVMRRLRNSDTVLRVARVNA